MRAGATRTDDMSTDSETLRFATAVEARDVARRSEAAAATETRAWFVRGPAFRAARRAWRDNPDRPYRVDQLKRNDSALHYFLDES